MVANRPCSHNNEVYKLLASTVFALVWPSVVWCSLVWWTEVLRRLFYYDSSHLEPDKTV